MELKKNDRIRPDTKRLTLLSVLVAVAMILSYVESLVPAFVAVPGVKMGLSNIATVFALYTLGPVAAISVSLVRVCLSALLFGNAASLIYSLFGAAFALLAMILLKRLSLFSAMGVSVAGGVFHNVGQILMAMWLLGTAELGYYLIVLAITGTVSGVFVGLCGGMAVKRIPMRNMKYPC